MPALRQRLADIVPAELLEDPPADALTSAGAPGTAPPLDAARERAREQFRRGRSPYAPDNQPRDYRGRYRQVLARLRKDLTDAELKQEAQKVKDAEEAELNGDYVKSARAATDVIGLVDRLDADALDPKQLQNIQATTRELGKVIAYLPLPQGNPNAKLRFSDLPPASQKLLTDMESRLRDKIDPSKINDVLAVLNRFTSGVVQLSSDELQAELSRLLRYLIK